MSKKYYLIILLGLGLLTGFIFFSHTPEVVFDEVHFGKFVSDYYTHEFYLDIHPPLGKLMIAGFVKIFDFKPGFDFAKIGEKYPDNQYLALRFLPRLAGALLPVIIYLILLELGLRPVSAFIGGLMVILENGILVQSRFILLDVFLLLFGFTSLLFYLKYRKNFSLSYLVPAGIFMGLAISIKWTALSFLGLPVLFEGYRIFYNNGNHRLKLSVLKNILTTAFCLFLIPFTIYFATFIIEFKILDHSGTYDSSMTAGFQKTLKGNMYENDPGIKPSNLFQKFIELNFMMYEQNKRNDIPHPFSSHWYSWPLMSKPIPYWVSSNGTARIDFIGSPIIWWSSTVALMLLIISSTRERFRDKNRLIILSGYFANLVPFIAIGRTTFLYHYLTALIFAIIILVYLLDKSDKSYKISKILLLASILSFIILSPLSYGTDTNPVTDYTASLLK